MAKLKSIKRIKNRYNINPNSTRLKDKYVYDIEVEGNHNYLANDLLVSNSAASTYREVSENHLKNCYFRFGVTATNFRNNGDGLALEGVLSDVLYEYSLDQAFNDGYLVRPKFEIIEVSYNGKSYKNYQDEYRHGIVLNELRNNIIQQICADHANRHIIILVQRIEHGEILKDMISGSEFINGKEKDSYRERCMADFREGKLKILIGINSILGEGVDLPIADCLIMAGGGKSRGQIMQNVGRVLRLYEGKTEAFVYDFDDIDCPRLLKHSDARVEVYESYSSES